jgi:hypothetical protein
MEIQVHDTVVVCMIKSFDDLNNARQDLMCYFKPVLVTFVEISIKDQVL